MKKKLAVTIASVAAASFILGTLLNLDFITTAKVDDGPMPVWPTYITGVNATALPEAWNVNVTNWPVSTDVSVWAVEDLDSEILNSPMYKANGFGQLHVLAQVWGLEPTETVYFSIYGVLWDATHTGCSAAQVTVITLTGLDATAAITIPVPGAEFFITGGSDYECVVSLNFYLTWA